MLVHLLQFFAIPINIFESSTDLLLCDPHIHCPIYTCLCILIFILNLQELNSMSILHICTEKISSSMMYSSKMISLIIHMLSLHLLWLNVQRLFMVFQALNYYIISNPCLHFRDAILGQGIVAVRWYENVTQNSHA